MSTPRHITFVAAVNSREILNQNFLASPCFRVGRGHQIIIQENFSSAAKAYNDAIDKSLNDLIVFCHQDIILPEQWLSQLEEALDYLRANDPKWGVLGTFGRSQDGRSWGYVYTSGRGVVDRSSEHPAPVQTLDEIVLILRKSSGLRFDDRLPHFHFYGTDICLRAAKMGRRSYAVSVFCIHNTHQNLILPKEFYECCKYVKRAWNDSLPIQTTCIRITRSNVPLYKRRLHEIYLRYIRRKELGGTRTKDVPQLLEQLKACSHGSPRPL